MRLFWRIFFFFWIATILMITLVLTVNEFAPMSFPGEHDRRFQPDATLPALTAALNAYEHQGQAAFRSQAQRLPRIKRGEVYLFDQQGSPLLANSKDYSFYALMAQDVLQSGHPELIRLGLRVLYACPLESASGQNYAAVFTIFTPSVRLWSLRLWSNLTIGMIPAAFVCMLLTFYLTRPIIKLQSAAQRLANGELDARAGPLKFNRRDELGDLARDFDTMAAQIQSLMTAQRRFVVDVSHELSAPLTRMHLALALLRREFGGNASNALTRIERETDKLSNLVQQLLLLAGLEAGRVPSETLAPVSMRTLCDTIVEDEHFEATHSGLRITGSREDITLLAYPNLLRRAIDNVLRNAIRYSPSGTEIQLDCRVDLKEREVVVDVLDHGHGVPESALADIFRPFFRTAPGREASSGGTGLGLAIANEAVRLHDGTIEACNRKGSGLQVTIRLPLRRPVPDEPSDYAVEAETPNAKSD
jgi:two-component system, OmpR family, sensor histidine kinase CpxA